MNTVTIGRIVEFFPNNNEVGLKLPNGMQSAPAIVVQVFEGPLNPPMVNLNVFTADTEGNPVKVAWSIQHQSEVTGEGTSYWNWFPRV